MKLFLTYLIFFLFISSLYGVGLPHAVYFQVYAVINGEVVYPDTINFTSWITDREDEVLTEKSFGCSFFKNHSLASVQVGNFTTPWKAGELLNIEVNSPLGYGFRTIELTNDAYQYFVKDYQGDDGLLLKKQKAKASVGFLIKENPFNNKLIVILDNNYKIGTIEIYKNDKMIVQKEIKEGKTEYSFDLKNRKAGIYIIKLKTDNKEITKKAVKI